MLDRTHKLREYDIFRQVYLSGSVSEAAKQLGLAQPAVSQSLLNLELSLGCKLFKRDSQSLHPTPQAFALIEKLKPLFEGLDRITSLENDREDKQTALRVLTDPEASEAFTLSIFTKLVDDDPDLKFQLDKVDRNSAETLLTDRYAELAIFADGEFSGKTSLICHPFAQSRLCAFLPADHPLAGAPRLSAKDLSGEPIIAADRNGPLTNQIRKCFEEENAALDIVVYGASGDMIAEFLKQDLGIALAPYFSLSAMFNDKLVAVPFVPDIRQNVVIAHLAGDELSQAAKSFIDLATQAVHGIAYTDIIESDPEHQSGLPGQ